MVQGMRSFADRHMKPPPDTGRADPYNWDGLTGWKSYRMLRPFRGMYHDVRRRLPYYASDIGDAFTYRVAAATIRMYFVNLLPALAFTLDMSRRTDGYFGINEALFSSALAAMIFSIFSAQPITIVGITGLISLYNYTIFLIAEKQGIRDLYPEFIAWVSIWAAITHWIMSIGNLCDYMRYITDFSSNSFAAYVGLIYLIKGVQELINQFGGDQNDAAGFLSAVIALCYFFTVYVLELLPTTSVFTPTIRKVLSDYAYPICTIFWAGFGHIAGPISQAQLLTLPTTPSFRPTQRTDWFVRFYTLPAKWVFVALPIGILVTLLFYYDHNLSSITAQARRFPLKKPAGFHWDFFLLGITCFVGGILGLPLPNGLVPQAPVHTDSLTQYDDHLHVTYEREDDDGPLVERRRKTVDAMYVVEQRVSHFLMGLLLIGTMTGPLQVVLHTIPRAVFVGVFFVVGWGSIEGNGITTKLLFLLTEHRFVDPAEPLLKVKKRKIVLFILFQILGVGLSVGLSQTIGAIGFPIIVLSLIPLRWNVYPRWFDREELVAMDALTANSDVVLASLGGRPEMPEEKRDKELQQSRNIGGEAASPQSNGSGMSDGYEGRAEEDEGKRE